MDEASPATKKVRELHVRKKDTGPPVVEPVEETGTNINGIEEPEATVSPVKGGSLLNDILKLLLKILVIVLVFMLLFTFLFGTAKVQNDSMDPNIKEGDRIIYYRLDKNYVATNCVAYQYNGQTEVMRVVAVAGDTVDMTEDGLVINGALQSEPDPTKETKLTSSSVDFPIQLQKGEVFLMGDNRPESTDSRVFGPVLAKDTKGELMTIIRSET